MDRQSAMKKDYVKPLANKHELEIECTILDSSSGANEGGGGNENYLPFFPGDLLENPLTL